jgi:hypothetical protein
LTDHGNGAAPTNNGGERARDKDGISTVAQQAGGKEVQRIPRVRVDLKAACRQT